MQNRTNWRKRVDTERGKTPKYTILINELSKLYGTIEKKTKGLLQNSKDWRKTRNSGA